MILILLVQSQWATKYLIQIRQFYNPKSWQKIVKLAVLCFMDYQTKFRILEHSISLPRQMVMRLETELVAPPFYLLARQWHRRSHVDNHWPLSEYTLVSELKHTTLLQNQKSQSSVFRDGFLRHENLWGRGLAAWGGGRQTHATTCLRWMEGPEDGLASTDQSYKALKLQSKRFILSPYHSSLQQTQGLSVSGG
jgi:hypothetical protein